MGTSRFHSVTSLPTPSEKKDFDRWEKAFLSSITIEGDEFVPYYLVIRTVRNELLNPNIPLSKLTKSYVQNSLNPVITTLIQNLNKYKGKDKTVIPVVAHLRKARVALNIALEHFSNQRNTKLIEGKIEALSNAEKELTDALAQWYHVENLVKEKYPNLLTE